MSATPAATQFLDSSTAPVRLRRARPLLLLHGFLSTPLSVNLLAAELGRSGYCTHRVDLGGLFGRFSSLPVEEVAGVVAERVERLARDHGVERLDLVGHSQGGLIGRYYVQNMNGARRVRHLVTLGTPHRGTSWAYTGYLVGRVLPGLWQMAPGSPLLRELADDDFPRSVRLTSVYSKGDSICPPSSCRLEDRCGGHLKNVEVAHGGHLDFLFRHTISAIVRRELDSEELLPAAPGRRSTGVSSLRPPVVTGERRTSSAARAA
jgi:pimeloyl-ACP methyl ester carboxylesterase